MRLRDNKGMALPLVLIVMFVITLLATAVLQYSIAESVQVSRNEKRMQAHYLARSGADAMAEYLIRTPSQVVAVVAKTNSANMATGTLGLGKDFRLDVAGNTVNGIIISAEGTSGGVTAKINLDLTPLSAAFIFNHAISSKQDLNVSSMKVIDGSLESGGTITPVRENDLPNSTTYYPSPIVPVLNFASNINIENKEKVTLTESRQYSSITMASNAHLEFKTGGKVLQIVVDTFVAKGNVIVDVSGGGRLELFITGSADIQTPLVVNDGDPNSLFIFLKDGAHLNISANGTINGYIYGPNANVGIQSAHTIIKGAVIANLVSKSDNNPLPSNGGVIFHPVSAQIGGLSGVVILRRGLWRD